MHSVLKFLLWRIEEMSEKTSRRKSSKAALMLGTSLVGSIGAAASSAASTASAGIWSWIKDSTSSFGEKLKNTVNSIDDATGNYASWAGSKFKEKAGNILESAKNGTKSLYNSADDYFEGGISNNANKLWEKTKDFGGTVAEKADKLEGVLAKGTNAISEGAKKAFNYVDGKWGNKISSFAKENVEKLKNSEFAKSASDWGSKIAESDLYETVAPYTVDVVKNHYRTIVLIIGGCLTYKFYKSYKNKNEEKKEENKDSNAKRGQMNSSSQNTSQVSKRRKKG